MKVKALILGAIEKSGVKDGKAWSMKVVSFVDTENPSGSSCEMTLDKETPIVDFINGRMKTVEMNIFQNGKYINFGGFVKA